MEHELVTVPDAESLASRAAEFVAGRARAAVADHRQFSFAVSGGMTPWAMFAQLAHHDLPWASVRIYQVDERVAPDGDPDRNLTHLRQALDLSRQVLRYPQFTIFDSINAQVDDGVVTLSGRVTMPYKRDAIAERISRIAGVRQVRNEIGVLPVSQFDDELRYHLEREIERQVQLDEERRRARARSQRCIERCSPTSGTPAAM